MTSNTMIHEPKTTQPETPPVSESLKDESSLDDALPKASAEPIELQVAAFQRRLARVLGDVLIGQRYIISAHATPKAVLQPLTRRAPAGASTVMRKEFEDELSAYLNEVQAGGIIIVRSARGPALPAPRAEAVVARPAPKRLVDERRALAEANHKESGRNRMRKVRERRKRQKAERRAEMEEKLKAIDGMTVEEIRRARKLWESAEQERKAVEGMTPETDDLK